VVGCLEKRHCCDKADIFDVVPKVIVVIALLDIVVALVVVVVVVVDRPRSDKMVVTTPVKPGAAAVVDATPRPSGSAVAAAVVPRRCPAATMLPGIAVDTCAADMGGIKLAVAAMDDVLLVVMLLDAGPVAVADDVDVAFLA